MIRRLKRWFNNWFQGGPETWDPTPAKPNRSPAMPTAMPYPNNSRTRRQWPTACLFGGPGDGETIPIPPILDLTSKYIAFDRIDHGEMHRYASTGEHAQCGCLVLVYIGRNE